MKDIGLKLKNKREESGLSVIEVADDLKVKPSDIENLEEGSRDSFKDIIFVKSLIQDYAKYLGYDGEEMLDQFNEYLFDQTSRISLEDIEKAKELKEKHEKEKVFSPYTMSKKEKSMLPFFIGGIIIFLLVVFLISYFVVGDVIGKNSQVDSTEISYMFGGK